MFARVRNIVNRESCVRRPYRLCPSVVVGDPSMFCKDQNTRFNVSKQSLFTT